MTTILVLTKELDAERALNGDQEQAGYRVVTASDEQTALIVLGHERPDLVMLDLALADPDKLGF